MTNVTNADERGQTVTYQWVTDGLAEARQRYAMWSKREEAAYAAMRAFRANPDNGDLPADLRTEYNEAHEAVQDAHMAVIAYGGTIRDFEDVTDERDEK